MVFISSESKEFGELFGKSLLIDNQAFTEELLKEHEECLDTLKFIYQESQTLFEKTKKWLDTWEEFLLFDERTKDPARLKKRGYNMLEEEKQRKQFQTQMPKLEDEINKLAAEYEKMNAKKFCINGIYYIDYISGKKQEHEENKIIERKEKQIMRGDTLKPNQSKYVFKATTPLTLSSNKRRNDNDPSHLPSSKLFRQDNETTTISINSKMGTSKLSSATKPKPPQSQLKSNKRNSKTPVSRSRRSKIASAAAASNKKEITVVTATPHEDNTFVDKSKMTMLKLTESTAALLGKKDKICAPLSSLSKHSTRSSKQPSNLIRMTSTASNTFIEEEEQGQMEPTTFAPNTNFIFGATINESKAGSDKLVYSRFGFHFDSKLAKDKVTSNCDINYFEFSKDLTACSDKQQSSVLSNTTNKQMQTSKSSSTSTSSMRAAPNNKLTSTLIKDN
jgi:hypothetical protein